MSIVIENLCKSFGTHAVLQNFNWTVDRPMVLMGASGCGKTTMLRILSGLETADSGTVTGVVTPAVVFQEDRLCPQLTAVDNLVLTGHGLTAAQARSDLQSLAWMPTWCAMPPPLPAAWQGSGPRFWSPMIAPQPSCSAGLSAKFKRIQIPPLPSKKAEAAFYISHQFGQNRVLYHHTGGSKAKRFLVKLGVAVGHALADKLFLRRGKAAAPAAIFG